MLHSPCPIPSLGELSASSYLHEVALSARHATHDQGSQSTSDTAEEGITCPDIVSGFSSVSTNEMIDYAWRPITDQNDLPRSKLLGSLGDVAHKKRGSLCHTEPRQLWSRNRSSR